MKTRNIMVFLFLVRLTLLNQVSYAIDDSYCGGKTTFVFSSSPRLGMVTTLTLEHTPDIKLQGARGWYVHLFFHFDEGAVEVVGGNKGEEESAEKFEVGKVYKKSIQIKVKRLGLWSVGGIIYYSGYPTKKDPQTAVCAAIGGATLVVTENEVVTYYYGKDTLPASERNNALKMASYMVITTEGTKGVRNYQWGNMVKRNKLDEAKAEYIAYLPKGIDLSFEPTYRFRVEYYNFTKREFAWEGPLKGKFPPLVDKPKGARVWRVEGDIGTIDETGLFTATKFGKGNVCAKHGVLEDCMDVEVVPLPNPSPAEKIVDFVMVPYDTAEEKKNVDNVIANYKNKKFKTKKEVHEKLNPKGGMKEVHKIMDKYFGEVIKVHDKITLKVSEKKLLIAKGVTADGRVVDPPKDFSFHGDCYMQGIIDRFYADETKSKFFITALRTGQCEMGVGINSYKPGSTNLIIGSIATTVDIEVIP